MPPRPFARRELLARLRSGAGAARGHWIRIHRPAMACRFEVTLASEDASSVRAARLALEEVDDIEAELTVFREESALARVNREAASRPVRVSPDLMTLLGRCRALHLATGGCFDPTSTPLSRAWGFLARQGRQPSTEELEAARARVGMERVVLDPGELTVAFRAPGVELNLGSVGKGWALDRVEAGLRAVGADRALVSAGGSSFRGWGREAWHVALRPGGEPVGELWVGDGALGTSGTGEQHFLIDGRRRGHVIDPRTGQPAEGVQSATVVADDATTADALATALLVGGPALARAWCREHPETIILLVLEDDPQTLVQIGARGRVAVAPAPGLRLETPGA